MLPAVSHPRINEPTARNSRIREKFVDGFVEDDGARVEVRFGVGEAVCFDRLSPMRAAGCEFQWARLWRGSTDEKRMNGWTARGSIFRKNSWMVSMWAISHSLKRGLISRVMASGIYLSPER
jgi:hypothetical protein